VCSPSLTEGLHANKKNEIRSAGSQDISTLNLGVVNSSQTYGTLERLAAKRLHSLPCISTGYSSDPSQLYRYCCVAVAVSEGKHKFCCLEYETRSPLSSITCLASIINSKKEEDKTLNLSVNGCP
jgi:hypothetical protein